MKGGGERKITLLAMRPNNPKTFPLLLPSMVAESSSLTIALLPICKEVASGSEFISFPFRSFSLLSFPLCWLQSPPFLHPPPPPLLPSPLTILARSMGLLPSMSSIRAAADPPRSLRSSFTARSCPAAAASCSGVMPLSFRASERAPQRSSKEMHVASPWIHKEWRREKGRNQSNDMTSQN